MLGVYRKTKTLVGHVVTSPVGTHVLRWIVDDRFVCAWVEEGVLLDNLSRGMDQFIRDENNTNYHHLKLRYFSPTPCHCGPVPPHANAYCTSNERGAQHHHKTNISTSTPCWSRLAQVVSVEKTRPLSQKERVVVFVGGQEK